MATTNPQAQSQHGEREASDLSALLARQAATRPELLQMRMENETIMAECRAQPRDLGDCKRKLCALLKEFPEFAEDAVYRRPVGKEEGSDRQKIAEGLSIRAAEALAEAYGYNRVRGDVTRIDANTAKVDATFTDFATGRIWQDGRLVSQVATKRDGSQYRINDDRFSDIVCGAAKSRAIREVIVRSVNPALKAWFENECRKITATLLTESRMDEMVAAFDGYGINLVQLEALLGRARSLGWTTNERVKALEMFNALKNNETTVADLLAMIEPANSHGTSPAGGAPAKSLDDVTKTLADAKSKPKSKPATTPATEPQTTLTQDQEFAWASFVEQLQQCTKQSQIDTLGLPKAFSAEQETAAMKLIAAKSQSLKGA